MMCPVAVANEMSGLKGRVRRIVHSQRRWRMPLYPARALERAMKISEVITRAISGKINWIQAAEILGMSDRQLRRGRGNWDKYGYGGLFDRRTKRPSPKRVPMADVERGLRLYRKKYFDLNVKRYVEKLHREE